MLDVRTIGHATFATPDIQRLTDYYTDVIGLRLTERTRDRAYLASADHHHSIVLDQAQAAQCTGLAFQLAAGTDLAESMRRLAEIGVNSELETDHEPGIARSLRLTDPKGTSITVFAERETTTQGFAQSGIVPSKLGHIAYNAVDLQTSVNWYVNVLGFRVSDWIPDHFFFLRCGPDHHTINIVQGEVVKMHHLAFELHDIAHVQRACDILSRSGYPLLWGPGRHGIGHNIFTYHRNPDGHVVELFTDLDRIADESTGIFEPRPWHRDRPQRPQSWAGDITAANLWGVAPPERFLS